MNDETTRAISLVVFVAAAAALALGIVGSWPLVYGLAIPFLVGSGAFGLTTRLGR